MLSEYQLQTIEDIGFSLGKIKRLIPNLGNKRKIQTSPSKLGILFKFRVTIWKSYIIQTITIFKTIYRTQYILNSPMNKWQCEDCDHSKRTIKVVI